MLKIGIMSDLHTEMGEGIPLVDADVVVYAGDIGYGTRAVFEIASVGSYRKILVPGNHEYYGGEINSERTAMKMAGARDGVDVLDCNSVVISGVRFLGCTMWTDFELYGSDEDVINYYVERGDYSMNDFRGQIRDSGSTHGYFSALRSRLIHKANLEWLVARLREKFYGPTVVVTHHTPSEKSVHYRYKTVGKEVNPCYTSNLEWVMKKYSPNMWVHGHTHVNFDYMIGSTRIVCNPRGYPYELHRNYEPLILRI